MEPQAVAALVNLGVAGVGLYLFATGKLRPKSVDDEAQAQGDARLAEQRALYERALADRDLRITDERRRGDEWRALALGTERRLDQVAPVVAAAAGVPVPSVPAAPTEAPGT